MAYSLCEDIDADWEKFLNNDLDSNSVNDNNISTLNNDPDISLSKVPNFDSIKAPINRAIIKFTSEDYLNWYEKLKLIDHDLNLC